jgi:putative membrane protein
VDPRLQSALSMPMDAHIVMGGALSFLVVFRTNSSYNRWWEARCTWEHVISTCRSHATSVAATLRSDEAREQVLMLIMAYIVSLKASLRDEKVCREEVGGRMDWRLIRELNAAMCPPLLAVHKISGIVKQNLPLDDERTEGDESAINAAIFIESTALIRELVSAIGVCERIKMTPMTYGYVAALRSFLVLWLGTLPLVLVGEYGWLAPPALSVISFLFLSIEQMAIEIEQPFGADANDLPIEKYILDLESTIYQLLPGRQVVLDADDGGENDDGPQTVWLDNVDAVIAHDAEMAKAASGVVSGVPLVALPPRPGTPCFNGIDTSSTTSDPHPTKSAPPLTTLTHDNTRGDVGMAPRYQLRQHGRLSTAPHTNIPSQIGGSVTELDNTEDLVRRFDELRNRIGERAAVELLPSVADLVAARRGHVPPSRQARNGSQYPTDYHS